MKRIVQVEASEGTVEARLFLPGSDVGGDGPSAMEVRELPLIVFFMDAFGLRPALDAMGERLAGEGFAVLQPDLYGRLRPYEPFDPATAFSDPEEGKRIRRFMASVRPGQVVADTTLLVGHLVAEQGLSADTFGTLGYCMGGRMSFIAACRLPVRVTAAASIHGGGLVQDGPDSPHLEAGKIRGELYLGVADEDRSCTPEDQEALRRVLDEAGVDYELELYAGARHGFAISDHGAYDREAAEQHWKRILDLFS